MQLEARAAKAAESLRRAASESFVAKSFQCVPFFTTLPELTQRQVAGLFQIVPYSRDDYVCRQGDPGDTMYIVLYGRAEVWRRKRRGQPKEFVAAYMGTSDHPWFGEVFQWVKEHARAGDVLISQDTLTLALHRSQLEEFVFHVPGFKALTMSMSTGFSIKAVRRRSIAGEAEPPPLVQIREQPFKYAVAWARLVGKMLGIQGMGSVVMIKVQQTRQLKGLDTKDWMREAIILAEGEDEAAREEDAEGMQHSWSKALAEQRGRLLEIANEAHYGDSRTLASAASSRSWRTSWSTEQQIRAEQLRRSAATGELALARIESRSRFKPPETLPESFPMRMRAYVHAPTQFEDPEFTDATVAPGREKRSRSRRTVSFADAANNSAGAAHSQD